MHINLSLKVSQWVFMTILELSVKSCPLGPELHPSIDASSLHGCCRQSNEILLNKGMKYWDSGLSARGARTFIGTVHIAGAVISWRRSEKERTGQSQFSTQFAAKLSFMPRWSPGYLLLVPVFWNLIHYATEQGVPVRLFLTLRITLMSNYIITFVFKWSPLMCLRFS
jgi:hypothetical protein